MGKATLQLQKGDILKKADFDGKYLLILEGYMSLNLAEEIPVQYYSQKHLISLDDVNENLFYIAKTPTQLLALEKDMIEPKYLKTSREEYQHYRSLYMSSEERVKYNLRYLGERLGTKTDCGIELPSFLNQNEFANYCNISRVFLNSLMKRLKEDAFLISTKRPWLICPVETPEQIPVNN
ncbi:Crp/Fnr family transcriptional regulator [Listeria ilorinensis]|uniref:Crp/Fnr family transcriptional regulator n=1 Tax=Listeria ilorinensis TaxID=2867439 RepID=UPI001EF4637D|nr:Crp/Fnr family transcriptional regulator [Listeria ilorinensis]